MEAPRSFLASSSSQTTTLTPRILPSYFENIIDKKVHHVALNIFEKLVDILCSYIYKAYQERLTFRLTQSSVSKVDVKALLDKAKIYTDGLKTDIYRGVFPYIKEIVEQKNFQNNPQGFLNQWKMSRRSSEEYRIPEDTAFEFLQKEFPKN